jgi:hypothetical protein
MTVGTIAYPGAIATVHRGKHGFRRKPTRVFAIDVGPVRRSALSGE